MREAGYGLKAATITPEGADDVGSPNRILREAVDGKVIVRTGRRIPGVVGPVAGVHYPISVVRMAVGDAYGAKEWRESEDGDEVAYRTERITRSTCRAVAEFSFRTAERMDGKVYGGPKWTVSPVYEGMLKEEMDAAAARHPDVVYQPVLVDALYAGLISGAADAPLVIPSLNRDGDCISDLVMPMFGSIAGAESVLLAFDEDFDVKVAMAEAPHGTAPVAVRQGPREPDGDDPGVRGAARAGGDARRARRGDRLARHLRGHARDRGVGVKTVDLGGHASTTEFTDAVIERIAHQARDLGLAGLLGLARPPAHARRVMATAAHEEQALDDERDRPGDDDRPEVDGELPDRTPPRGPVLVRACDAHVGRGRDRGD